jgi:hypothetical protein
MLLSFRFANHRSFRDEHQLNLVPACETGTDTRHEDALQAVPVAAIFGANASGKSNVISAIKYLSDMVGESDRESEPGRGPRRQPFRLDPAIAARPSSYVADLALDGVHFSYGFAVDASQVTEEWLYSYPFRRKRVIFERTGRDFSWGEESGRSNARRLAEIVAPAALLLSVAARFDPATRVGGSPDPASESLHRVFSELRQKVFRDEQLSRPGLRERQYHRWLSRSQLRSAIVELLRGADVGLLDVLPGEENAVLFRHSGAIDGVLFGIGEESSGTLRLFELAARAVQALDAGGIFLVDEIDASLHPLLTAALVRLFQSREVNKHGGQLIFTTHDATLLGSTDGEDLLRRDEVWFTSKGGDGASGLFPLSELRPRRQGENREKRYLNGTYGAIPELSTDARNCLKQAADVPAT